MIVVFFPECGLVMFMSLYYWVINFFVNYSLPKELINDSLTDVRRFVRDGRARFLDRPRIVECKLNQNIIHSRIWDFTDRPTEWHVCDIAFSRQILGAIQVFSLYSQWKEEKNVSRRLRDLSMVILFQYCRLISALYDPRKKKHLHN